MKQPVLAAGRAILVGLLVAAPACADPALPRAPACTTPAEPLPAAFVGWTKPTPLMAARRPADVDQAVVPLGIGVDAAMRPTPEVTYAARPANPGGQVSMGGLFRLTLDHAGTYRVALGNRSWIDVVVDGRLVASTSHTHGPACSGIQKVVDFVLPAGRHLLQLSAGATPRVTLLVVEKR